MAQWHYRYAGLSIASALPIPEWKIFETSELFGDPDVSIQLNGTLDSTTALETKQSTDVPLPSLDPAFPRANAFPAVTSTVSTDEYQFTISETGAYQVLHGREIIITPAPNAGANELRLFLLGSAWGALCYQRGILALHTSVVQVGDYAVAFCGASGAGKSSLAAGLIARGYPLVGDDLCCLDFTTGVPRVYPSAPRLKLWREALTNLGWQNDAWVRDHFRIDKFHVTAPQGDASANPSDADKTSAVDASPLPLRAIYILEWGDLALTRLTGMNAVRRLIESATYRSELIEPFGQTGAYWERCVQLAQATMIWEFKRPRDWAMMDAALTALVDNW